MSPEPFYINTCGAEKVPPQWRQYPAIEMQRLYLIRGGRGGFMRPDGVAESFVPGVFYVFPYNLKAQFFSDPADPIDHVFFDFLSAPPIIAPHPLVYSAEVSPLRELAALLAVVKHTRAQMGMQLLRTTLQLLDQAAALPCCTDRVVCAALEIMHRQYAEPLTVTRLAAQLHFEENYFIRRFRSEMGQTPYAYLRAYRLMRAEELLAHGNTMAQAANQVGYENASSLARALRARGTAR